MAVTCWLTANVSSWASAGSVIYYYDETEPVEEDRIKPYNSLPKSGDTFYMNGYNNTQASGYTVNIPNGIIRNDLNPYTGRTGGQATGTGNNGTVNYICKEIHVGDTVFHTQGSNGNATINVTGDIYCEGTASFFYKAGNGVLYLRVTGNVYRGVGAALTTAYSDRPGNIIINGNYYGYNVISTSGMNNSVTIMNEQILINYTKTEDSFLLAIISGDKSKVYNEETEEAVAIVNQIKDIINH